ncbi:MAG: hypothetical protein N2747_10615 [Chitinophagaceae bacterium]|nr:hypothetical protein [Chitinophagaceae bacterium]
MYVFSFILIASLVFLNFITIGLHHLSGKKTLIPNPDSVKNIFLIVGLLVTAGVLYYAWNYFDRKMKKIRETIYDLHYVKVSDFRFYLIKYMAMCMAPSILGTVIFFLTGTYYALILSLAGIVAMIMKFPSKKKLDYYPNTGGKNRL